MKIQEFVQQLEEVEVLLNQFADSMKLNPKVISSKSSLAVPIYACDLIEAYVDLELSNGNALTWWSDMTLRENTLVLEISTLETDKAGEKVISSEEREVSINPEETISILRNSLYDFRQSVETLSEEKVLTTR